MFNQTISLSILTSAAQVYKKSFIYLAKNVFIMHVIRLIIHSCFIHQCNVLLYYAFSDNFYKINLTTMRKGTDDIHGTNTEINTQCHTHIRHSKLRLPDMFKCIFVDYLACASSSSNHFVF